MQIIKTEKLTKYYGKARGIVDLDLEINRGEFFGFIGPNGAGKSTTIRTLLGLISPTSGSAQILGMDIIKDKISILERVGYLPSETTFYSGMKVKDVLKLSADMRKQDCSEQADLLCKRLQLDVNKKVDELSFGNKKKVAIVCALQHKPELLILDEPTSGLDPLMQKEFFDILHEHNKQGATIFLSSHVLSEVQRNCTRAAIIREGKIIACDSVENLSKTNAKRVSINGNVNFNLLDGIRDKKISSNSASFLYSGDINHLVKTLADSHITDLTITDPDMDEIFLHYYQKEGDEA